MLLTKLEETCYQRSVVKIEVQGSMNACLTQPPPVEWINSAASRPVLVTTLHA